MKLNLIIVFFLIALSVVAQSDSGRVEHFKTKDFDGEIFPASSLAFWMLWQKDSTRFTPSKSDIERAEKLIRNKLQRSLKKGMNYNNIYFIADHINDYKRLYTGYIDTNGSKVIFITCYPKSFDMKWLEQEVIYTRDGQGYWMIRYSVKRHKLFGFFAPGEA